MSSMIWPMNGSSEAGSLPFSTSLPKTTTKAGLLLKQNRIRQRLIPLNMPLKQENILKKLQDFITEHFYTCTNEVLSGLGKMYAGGGEFTANIDAVGGEGTADFANKAIEVYCKE